MSVERKIFNELLDRLDDDMGNAGCNDFYLENTPENKRFAEAVTRHYFDECSGFDLKNEIREIQEYDGSIILIDHDVLGYLRHFFGFNKP